MYGRSPLGGQCLRPALIIYAAAAYVFRSGKQERTGSKRTGVKGCGHVVGCTRRSVGPCRGNRWVMLLTSGERVHQALVRVGRDVCVGGLFWLANLRVAFSEF